MGTGMGGGDPHRETNVGKELDPEPLTLQDEGLSFIPRTMLCSHSVFPLVRFMETVVTASFHP